MANGKFGRPKAADPRRHRYNFKLNDREQTRFRELLDAAGWTQNVAGFIVKRLLGEELRVYKSDPAAARYLARLSDLYWQFARVGNNYNQIVRQVNSHFSDQRIPRQLGALIGCTRELKALSEQIAHLTEEVRREWLHE